MKPEPSIADLPDGWDGMPELYGQFASMVRLAHLLTGSVAVAEDVVQDAFMRVAPRYALVGNPRAYLRTTVVNGCRSHHRTVIRQEAVSQRAASAEPVYDTPVVEFFDGLKALSERQRSAVVLRYYLGLADEEIASLLSCAPATVRVLIRRALARLRKVVTR